MLGERVKDVRDSPACVVADEHAMSQHLQRLLKAAGGAERTYDKALSRAESQSCAGAARVTSDWLKSRHCCSIKRCWRREVS